MTPLCSGRACRLRQGTTPGSKAIKPILNQFKPKIKNQTEIRPNQTKKCGAVNHQPTVVARRTALLWPATQPQIYPQLRRINLNQGESSVSVKKITSLSPALIKPKKHQIIGKFSKNALIIPAKNLPFYAQIKPAICRSQPQLLNGIPAQRSIRIPQPAVPKPLGEGRSPIRNRVVAGCCHPVATNVATLVVDYQRCNRCCHFSNFTYLSCHGNRSNPKKSVIVFFFFLTNFSLYCR